MGVMGIEFFTGTILMGFHFFTAHENWVQWHCILVTSALQETVSNDRHQINTLIGTPPCLLYLCMSVCLCVCVFACLLSVCLDLCPSYVCMPDNGVDICMSVCLLYVCMSALCLYVCLSVACLLYVLYVWYLSCSFLQFNQP